MSRLLPLLLGFLLASCATGTRTPSFAPSADAPVWPAPPDPARLQYVMSITEHRDLFTESGLGRSLARLFGGPLDSRLSRPFALALHPGGGLLVADPGYQCVHWYDWGSGRYRRLGADVEGGLPSPVGVAVDDRGRILVADSRRAAIERFGSDGGHLGRFAPDHAFRRPSGIAVDPATGNVLVSDVLAHEILVFSPRGELLRTLGGNGSEPGLFNFPTHLSLDTAGNVLVADSMNFRAQRLAPDGRALTVYGQAGNARGDFSHPKGVAAAAPDVFVAVEGLHDSLVFFDGAGRHLMTVGGPGSEPGNFWLPAGLAFDPARGLLFVADSYNSRVQVFRFIAPAPDTGDGEKGAVP